MAKLSREEVLEIVRIAREKGERPKLHWVDLSRTNLRWADLSGTDLRGADLQEASLHGTNLSGADLREANLCGADLFGTNFSGVDLRRTYLSGTIIRKANLNGANLSGANLSGENLNGANLDGANLSQANLLGVFLSGANLSQANLSGANLRQADLNRTDLSRADLSQADLSGADLTESIVWEADLSGTRLRNADFTEANLSEADLSRTDLTEVILSGTSLVWTIFADVDLSGVKGLETVKHLGPSTIGVDTLFRSKGQIPEVFLRGAGVPEALITYLPSIMAQPIQYYSCFISYASKDTAFAERLHADLQQKGVRCWFAPEDLKIGAKIRPSIDESIQLHDKLLLVLSEHSVKSQWVEQEVETALARERKQDDIVLFPIRLDNMVMEMEGGWPALIKNTRNIGDFCRWQKHKPYQKALQRLLRDLKVEKQ